MEKPILEYWHRANDSMWDHEEYPSVSLEDRNSFEKWEGVTCEISPDDNVKLSTHSGGGHGEGTHDDSGKTAEEWINLLHEAKKVALHYWG